jgi:UDP-N-acetyl-D-mannosaminuronate dehydrogenase
LKVLVAGLGTVGLPTAEYIMAAGLDVVGCDVNPQAVQRAVLRGIQATTRWPDVPQADVFVVCVSTHYDETGNLTPVKDVQKIYTMIVSMGNEEILVSIESTVLQALAGVSMRRQITRRFGWCTLLTDTGPVML